MPSRFLASLSRPWEHSGKAGGFPKELLGHSCIRSTMTYVHVANNMQKVNSPLDIFIRKGEEK